MQLVLEIQNGPGSGKKVTLRAGQSIKVGRTEWADMAIPDDLSISSIHFHVQFDGQTATVTDLKSRNGLFLNGQRIETSIVSPGDRLGAGKTLFAIQLIPDPVIPVPPVPAYRAPVRVTETEVEEARPETESVFSSSPRQTVNLPDGFVIPPPTSTGSRLPPRPTLPDFLGAAQRARVQDKRRPYTQGLCDEDAEVRREAMFAAAWTRQSWLLDFCRELACSPRPLYLDAIWLLAVLGQSRDLQFLLHAATLSVLGPARFRLLGSFGHPAVIPPLLEALEDPDPRTVVAAAAAFTQVTGADIDGGERRTLPPQDETDADEFEQEFLDEAMMPDPAKARLHWQRVAAELRTSTRIARGVDVSRGTPAHAWAQLDLPSHAEARLRDHWNGTREGKPRDIPALAWPLVPETK